MNQSWWHIPVISALRRSCRRIRSSGLLSYIVSLGPAWTTWEPCSETNNKGNPKVFHTVFSFFLFLVYLKIFSFLLFFYLLFYLFFFNKRLNDRWNIAIMNMWLFFFFFIRLWVMTVNALQPSIKFIRQQKYTQNDLMIDPLIVLRCDRRVHR